MPSHPGKEFEIKERLDKLRGTNNFNNNNDNNNNNGGNNNLFGPGGEPPSLPSIEDFLDGGSRPPPPPPPSPPPSISGNLFNTINTPSFLPTDDFNVQNNRPFDLRSIWNNKGIENNLFGSQAAMAKPEEKTKTQEDLDDFLFEMPERTMPDLELGDGLLNSQVLMPKIFFMLMLHHLKKKKKRKF